MEIRVKVFQIVIERIILFRVNLPDYYSSVTRIRTNAVEYLPIFVKKGQKIKTLFPGLSFKKPNHK